MCCLRTATYVIEVMTGLVVDYIVLSMYCYSCHLSDDRAGSGIHRAVNVLQQLSFK